MAGLAVGEALDADRVSDLTEARSWLADLAATTAVLWDLEAPTIGGSRSLLLQRTSAGFARVSVHLGACVAAVENRDREITTAASREALQRLDAARHDLESVLLLFPPHTSTPRAGG